MNTNNLVTLESSKRLSRSLLWDFEVEYFNQQGANAWAGTVPFFATSNPFIASCYAEIIIHYIMDLIQQDKFDHSKPFYIIELGAGSGQFAFYCVKRLQYLKQQFNLEADICHVMTDFTDSNIQFWQGQQVLQPLFEQGWLDTAKYNLRQPDELALHFRDCRLNQSTAANAVVAIANYVFDSTRHDLFHVEDDKLYESRVTLKSEASNLNERRWPKVLKEVDYTFDHHVITDFHYYEQPVRNALLKDYLKTVGSGSFVIPYDMFQALDHLSLLGKGQMMLLTTDKAYADLDEIRRRRDLKIAFHGNAFSITVNYHAVEGYFVRQGGTAYQQPPGGSVNSAAFVLGLTKDQLPATSRAVDERFCQFGPGDYYFIHRFVRNRDFDLEACLGQLRLSHWDPYVLSLHSESISNELPNAKRKTRDAYVEGMSNVADMIYPMPAMRDHYFTIAMIYHIAGHHDKAIGFYQSSVALPLTQADDMRMAFSYLNLAICLYTVERFEEAETAIESSCQLCSDHSAVEEWRDKILNRE